MKNLAKIYNFILRFADHPASYLALHEKNEYFFFPDGQCMIVYRIVGKTCLVFTDPIGNSEDTQRCLKLFVEKMTQRGLRIAFFLTANKYLDLYSAFNFRHITIGAEAIITVPEFSLEGSAFKAMRNNIANVKKQNIEFEWCDAADLSKKFLQSINHLYREWVGGQKCPELLNHLYPLEPLRKLGFGELLVARDANKKLIGVFSFYPYKQRAGRALDLMISSSKAPRGLVEASIEEAIRKFKLLNIAKMSLGFTGLISSEKIISRKTAAEQGLRFLYTNFNQLYNFRALAVFKNKFNPVWEPRFLVYQNDFELGIIIGDLIKGSLNESVWKKVTRDWKILLNHFS